MKNISVKELILSALANPKSSLAGVAVLVFLGAFWQGRITQEQFLGAFGVLTAGGLLVAKDSSK
jgi:hypothetical protein